VYCCLLCLAASPSDRSKFFKQTLDHFNRQDGRTFNQRYFVNDTFWDGPESNGPVFMCVGGEGPPLDASVLIDSVHCSGKRNANGQSILYYV
jgi:hypothetical protein